MVERKPLKVKGKDFVVYVLDATDKEIERHVYQGDEAEITILIPDLHEYGYHIAVSGDATKVEYNGKDISNIVLKKHK